MGEGEIGEAECFPAYVCAGDLPNTGSAWGWVVAVGVALTLLGVVCKLIARPVDHGYITCENCHKTRFLGEGEWCPRHSHQQLDAVVVLVAVALIALIAWVAL
jgi:LPXTG-motif cell wall-anchored protein